MSKMVTSGFRDVYERGKGGLAHFALMMKRLVTEGGLFMNTRVVFSTDQEGHRLKLS